MSFFLSKGVNPISTANSIKCGVLNDKSLACLHKKQKSILVNSPKLLVSHSMTSSLPKLSTNLAICGIGVPGQSRYAHTDVTKVPNFDLYRLDSTKDPKAKSSETSLDRRIYVYSMMLSGAVLAATASKHAVKSLVMCLGPTAKTLAESSTEVNLASIPEGKNIVVKWRNKPLFIRHRTRQEIDKERAVPISELRHQERDEDRVKVDKWLICLGVCTHLGCVPIAFSGDFGGYYCPCHGSHYDASGRIRKGPAPLNLEVPDYTFLDDNVVVVN